MTDTRGDHDAFGRGLHPSAALGAHLEGLVAGRRVAVLGDSGLALADELAARGARLVHVYDPEPGRAATSAARAGGARASGPARIVVAPLADDLGVRDGAFDLVVIPDLCAFARPADALRHARRLAGGTGVVACASPNPEVSQHLAPHAPRVSEPLGYYELYDSVALHFGRVRMLGQSAFVGYTVADFATEGDPDVTVDTSLLGSPEPPEVFVAIASERETDLPEYAVIGVPFDAVAAALAARASRNGPVSRGPISVDSPRALAARAAEEYAKRAADLEREVDALRGELASARAERDDRAKHGQAASARLAEIERAAHEDRAELEAAKKSHAAAERARRDEAAARDAAEARLEAAAREAAEATARAARLEHDLRDQDDDLRALRDRLARAADDAEAERDARAKAEAELAALRAKPDTSVPRDRFAETSAELDRAKAKLRELEGKASGEAAARERVAELEGRLKRLGRELDELRAAHEKTTALLGARDADLDRARAALAKSTAEIARLAELEARAADDAREARKALERRAAEPSADELADLAALERALVERGHAVRELEAQLREAERFGRELIADLEALRDEQRDATSARALASAQAQAQSQVASAALAALAAPALPAAPAVPASLAPASIPPEASDAAVRAQLEALAVAAAKREADLQAAAWRATQAERELARERRANREPGAREKDLEAALAAAQHELATLRIATATAGAGAGARQGAEAQAVAEQAALVHQVADAMLGR